MGLDGIGCDRIGSYPGRGNCSIRSKGLGLCQCVRIADFDGAGPRILADPGSWILPAFGADFSGEVCIGNCW